MATIQEVGPTVKPRSAANIALWVLQGLLALAFLMAGAFKLSGAPMMVEQFEKLGLGQWFRYLTGLLEILAAVGLVVPGASAFGAALLVPIMIGAAAAHVIVFKDSPLPPLVFLALALVVVWGRRAQIIAAIRPGLATAGA